jgi:hypothetical protein
MIGVVERLKSRIVLPMHAFGPRSMRIFLDGLAGDFAIERVDAPSIRVSRGGLPARPTIVLTARHRNAPPG